MGTWLLSLNFLWLRIGDRLLHKSFANQIERSECDLYGQQHS
ncbi:hypothetical protein [Chroococcidiopsis sp. SAG 2025]|nr:hypothetical protein [Chroococcidiopsis sp. SAG 2025]